MNFCLTMAGKEYMARVNAGELQMHLTRAATGSGSSSSLEILTSVVDEQQQIQLDEVDAQGEYTYITCVLTNLELEREYVLRQIGLYAADDAGAEKLVIIGQDPYGDRIPVLSEKEVEYQYNIGMRVSNAAEVVFDFSVNDFLRKKYFYEHLEEFEEYRKAIQKQFEDLPRVKVGPAAELDRKDTILFETQEGTNNVTRIRKRDHEDRQAEYALAAVFERARIREELASGDTLGILFGKISKFFADLKVNCFREADDPFVQMTEITYMPPGDRTEGSLYGLVTDRRGLVIERFDRYIPGSENPAVKRTLYGTAAAVRTAAQEDQSPYVGIFSNIVHLEEGQTVKRSRGMIYSVKKKSDRREQEHG